MNHQPARLGLALSGGGVRALAHIGVLKVLDEAGLRPSSMAGTSMGAIVGALYAAGKTGEELEAEVLRLTGFGQILQFVDWLPSTRGLMNGQSLSNYIKGQLGGDITFDDLLMPLAVTTTDMSSGKGVNLSSGSVIDAIRASLSLVGIFTPVERDGHRLVDGGFLNHLPVNVAREQGASVLVAVNINSSVLYGEEEEELIRGTFPRFTPPAVTDLIQINSIMVRELTRLRLAEAKPEFLLTPNIPPSIGSLHGLELAGTAIEAGAAAMRAVLPQLQQMMGENV